MLSILANFNTELKALFCEKKNKNRVNKTWGNFGVVEVVAIGEITWGKIDV